MQPGWKDKVALVVGATSGIGEATARTFARKGAKAIVSGRSVEAGERIASEIREEGGDAAFIACDLSEPESIDNLFADIAERYGRLDCAVNNGAHIEKLTRFTDFTREHWDRIMETNLHGTFLCMQHEIRMMKAQGGGAIANTSSLSANKGAAGYALYAASKWAINGLTKAAAVEFARANIRVNAIMPGIVWTPGAEDTFDEAGKEWGLSRIPMKRFGKSDEAADVLVWLCSEESSYVTGVIIPVDGGWDPS